MTRVQSHAAGDCTLEPIVKAKIVVLDRRGLDHGLCRVMQTLVSDRRDQDSRLLPVTEVMATVAGRHEADLSQVLHQPDDVA